MTWGAFYLYYHCPECGLKYEYALDLLTEFSNTFGFCPKCGIMGIYEKEGLRQIDDAMYLEVESEFL